MFDSIKRLFKDKPTSSVPDPDRLQREGKEHIRNGNWDGAASCYRQALAERGDGVDLLVGLGFVLSQQRQLPEAAGSLRRALALAPDNADAHYILGTIARDEGNRDVAITHLTKALELQPQLTDAYRDLSIAYFQSGQVDAAKSTIRQGISADPATAEFRLILGNILNHEKDHAGAVAEYQRGLSLQPHSPELHNNMGNALRDLGRIGPATTSYRAALAAKPDFADAHVNLGNIMRDEGRFPEALTHFEAAISSAPDLTQGHINASGILLTLNRADEALGLLDEALARLPDDPMLLFARGSALSALRRVDDAIAVHRHVIALKPEFVSAHIELGNLLVHKGHREEALQAYQRAVELDPANPVGHLISALSGKNTERAPDGYVASLFDFYADKFDSHLVNTLKYNIPNEIAALLRSVDHASRGAWDVLDLGCGTGLAGAAIATDARHVVGVDLSEKMLAKARALNVYARLEQADLLTMMRKEDAGSYDVVIAADVFVYIGRLDELAAEIRRLLRPGGLFAFSVEALLPEANANADSIGKPAYRLNDTGRYSHSKQYLEGLALAGPYEVLDIADATVRVNEGKPVPGYIGLFRR